MARIRRIMGGSASAGLVLLLLAGCLFLWIGVPLGWLWIGSQVQASASLSAALIVTMLGITITIIVVVIALAWVNRRHAALLASRGRSMVGSSALEVMLVWGAGIALVLFAIWFLGFAGASPLPLNMGF